MDKIPILRPIYPIGSVAANFIIKLVVLQDIIKKLAKYRCYKPILAALLKDNHKASRKEVNTWKGKAIYNLYSPILIF